MFFFSSLLKGFPGGPVVKNPFTSAGDTRDPGSILGTERSPGGGNGNPLEYCLENCMDRGAWWATANGVAKSQTPLSTTTTKLTVYLLDSPMSEFIYLHCSMVFYNMNIPQLLCYSIKKCFTMESGACIFLQLAGMHIPVHVPCVLLPAPVIFFLPDSLKVYMLSLFF